MPEVIVESGDSFDQPTTAALELIAAGWKELTPCPK